MYKKICIAILIVLMCLSPIAGANWISFGHDYNHTGFVKDDSDFVTSH